TCTVAVPAKVTRPRLIRGGSSRTNSFAASLAASIRLGETSVACMDSETSIAITTVARSRGTFTDVVGLAIPTVSVASASSSTANARCRRQPGRRGTRLPSSAVLVNRTAYRVRPICMTAYATARAATASSSHSHTGARKNVLTARTLPLVSPQRTSADAPPPGGDEPDDVDQPVPVGGQPQVGRSRAAQRRGDRGALGGRRG